jgi:hypothetical protein
LTYIEQVLNGDRDVNDKYQKEFHFIKSQHETVVQFVNKKVIGDTVEETLFFSLMQSINKLRSEVEAESGYNFNCYQNFRRKYARQDLEVIEEMIHYDASIIGEEEFDVCNINSNILTLSITEIETKAFELLCLVAPETTEKQELKSFVHHVSRAYPHNPYHNFTHGYAVMQVFYVFWKESNQLQKFLNANDLFVGCVASLGHDIGHRKIIGNESRQEQRLLQRPGPHPGQAEPLQLDS